MSVEELFGPDETDSENDEEDDNDVPSEHDDDSDFGDEAPPPAAPAQDDPAQEAQQAPSHQNNVEEDGHINAEGVDYRQPRPPFNGCAWSGVRNAFLRTDTLNTSRPRGSRPQGYIWVIISINGYRRTLAQTLADEIRLTAQMALRQRPQGTSTETALRPGRLEQLAAGNGLVHRCARS